MTAMLFAVGHVSGGHFNPAVTSGMVAAGRHPVAELIPYMLAQILGGIIAVLIWSLIAAGKASPADLGNFASNGYDAASPGGYSLLSVLLAEIIATAVFVFVFVSATSRSAPAGFAPIAIGLALFVCVLVTVPVSNGSINPARSTATALLGGGTALAQLWAFWVAPIIGGVIGGWIARFVEEA
jgi:aquaporin Z